MGPEEFLLDVLPEPPKRWTAWGEVTVTSPLTVQLRGDSAGVEVALKDAGYTPVVGDTVYLLRVGARWLVAGKVG